MDEGEFVGAEVLGDFLVGVWGGEAAVPVGHFGGGVVVVVYCHPWQPEGVVGGVFHFDPDGLDVFLPEFGIEVASGFFLGEESGPDGDIALGFHHGGGAQGFDLERLGVETCAAAEECG